MDWLNIPRASLQTPAFTEATTIEVGVWLRLAVYCASQENGGRIEGCRKWTPRQWMSAAGLEKSEIAQKSPLWRWTDGGSLYINHYPKEREAEVKKKREAGRATAKKRWGKATLKRSSAINSATSSASTEGEGKRNGTYHDPREINARLAVTPPPQEPE